MTPVNQLRLIRHSSVQLVSIAPLFCAERPWWESLQRLLLPQLSSPVHQLHHLKIARDALTLTCLHLTQFAIRQFPLYQLVPGKIGVKANVPALFQEIVCKVKHGVLLHRMHHHHLTLHGSCCCSFYALHKCTESQRAIESAFLLLLFKYCFCLYRTKAIHIHVAHEKQEEGV
ncbi:hypothetical protein TraAM80_02497 [Trypanosoma rangeli]|uniref:Uncharacterized protein n=1 Tax=Trypanosoma rangeli TaxID=5698 RepID=A0A3R7KLJ9_TRYRA|nr:uncharacterized protein TraAM80_02497 [Trypanosoma rangeli]RNF08864.1 hypothetical protein TraAM80_02497 [Trypanosoma rangeli]|eukprot:RNF08864.1 hypothetical protein TraAM80_02497 [Trypanosoma rangeli]